MASFLCLQMWSPSPHLPHQLSHTFPVPRITEKTQVYLCDSGPRGLRRRQEVMGEGGQHLYHNPHAKPGLPNFTPNSHGSSRIGLPSSVYRTKADGSPKEIQSWCHQSETRTEILNPEPCTDFYIIPGRPPCRQKRFRESSALLGKGDARLPGPLERVKEHLTLTI